MTNYEYVSIGIAFIGMLLLILKIWIKTQTDIAMLQINVKNSDEKHLEHKKDLMDHKKDNERELERLHNENRQDHQIMFNKLDEISNLFSKKNDRI